MGKVGPQPTVGGVAFNLEVSTNDNKVVRVCLASLGEPGEDARISVSVLRFVAYTPRRKICWYQSEDGEDPQIHTGRGGRGWEEV